MEIIFQGHHSIKEASDSLSSVLQLFEKRYDISAFCEMHLSVTLVDKQGYEVELVDSNNQKPYRIFEVYRSGKDVPVDVNRIKPVLSVVVDNTK